MIRFLVQTLLMLCLAAPVAAKDVTVFAAASLGDALQDIAEAWEAESGQGTTLVLAGSATLARQIEAGAPADVFVSANVDWMTYLAAQGLVDEASQVAVAANRLVLVGADPATQSTAELNANTDLEAILGPDGRLAIALPEAVPAGMYGKAALQHLGQWEGVKTRLAPTDNVRAALALVALGEAPLGIVYATDVMAEDRVVTAGVFPATSHPPILYPAAVVAESAEPDVAHAFVSWLVSEPAQAIFGTHGFLPAGSQK